VSGWHQNLSLTRSVPRIRHPKTQSKMEGTYVLPEAQADRFMFSINCGYPSNAEEALIVRNTTGVETPELKTRHRRKSKLLRFKKKLVRAMPISETGVGDSGVGVRLPR